MEQTRHTNNDPEEEDISSVIIPDELTGFEYVGDTANFEVYENKFFIPMGWAYDSYITQAEARKKSPVQREVIMIRSLVLTDEQDKKYRDILTEFDPEYYPAINRKTYEFFCRQKQQCSKSFAVFHFDVFETAKIHKIAHTTKTIFFAAGQYPRKQLFRAFLALSTPCHLLPK